MSRKAWVNAIAFGAALWLIIAGVVWAVWALPYLVVCSVGAVAVVTVILMALYAWSPVCWLFVVVVMFGLTWWSVLS